MKTFFFKDGERGIKNPSFGTEYTNLNLIWVKVHPKKELA
jgi:hypothetical protein